EAAAELAYLVGWMAYDDGRHGLAERYLIQALRLAKASENRVLGAHVLAGMSDQANALGRPSKALTLARSGQRDIHPDDSPACMTDLLILEARALAALGGVWVPPWWPRCVPVLMSCAAWTTTWAVAVCTTRSPRRWPQRPGCCARRPTLNRWVGGCWSPSASWRNWRDGWHPTLVCTGGRRRTTWPGRGPRTPVVTLRGRRTVCPAWPTRWPT